MNEVNIHAHYDPLGGSVGLKKYIVLVFLFVCLSVSLLKQKRENVGKAITLNYTVRPNLNSSRLFLREIRSFLVATNKLPA